MRSELPDAFVSISSEVLPQIREYERMSTTVANAYVGPKLTVYLSTLEGKLKRDGLTRAFYVVASNARRHDRGDRHPPRLRHAALGPGRRRGGRRSSSRSCSAGAT